MNTHCITEATSIREALTLLDSSGLGILVLVSQTKEVLRTVTDGDLRRLILAGATLESSVKELPPQKPITIPLGLTRHEQLTVLDEHQLDHLPAVDEHNKLVEIYDRKSLTKRVFLSAPHIGEMEKEYVNQAFSTNWIAPLGPNVDAFEAEMSDKIGIKAAAALSSGTAAIHLALRLLGVSAGDRVFCSSLTFVASAAPICYLNAEPVFIDSDAHTWNMSPSALERALSNSKSNGKLPKAIVLVNLYGQCADMDPILELANAYGVPIVEDAAESLGAKYKGRNSGTFGRLGVFSFNGNKIITTSGGGMLVSDDEQLIDRARFLSTQAKEPEIHYEHKEIGYNYRMSNILAGVGRGQLQVLDDRVSKRRETFNTYVEELSTVEGLVWMPEAEYSYSNRWLTACTLDPKACKVDKTDLINGLAEEFIEARPIWKPLHRQPVFDGCQYYQDGNQSVSDMLYETGLCLPSGTNMTQDDLSRVTSKIQRLMS